MIWAGGKLRVWPGRPSPLGATWDGAGTNFAIFSGSAANEGGTPGERGGVTLCLFDDDDAEIQVPLVERAGPVFHGYLPDVGPGVRYGFRVTGPRRRPGDLQDPSKLLLDPYARAVAGSVRWTDSVQPDPDGDSAIDSAPDMPRSVVVNPWFDWGQDRRPNTPWHRTVLYEAHVRGLTMLHPEVPPDLRGTYLGLCAPPIIDHLQQLGVTAVELMPVHQFVNDRRLIEMGLRNYWGYNSIGFFAPHNTYAVGGDRGAQVQEFKVMVKTLHEAGIEVILDVVYNHTAEGGAGGPVLSFKGLDNPGYYRLDPDDPSVYVDYTGTGNSLNMRHPNVLQLIMDSLRYWVEDMHVDGFRFDLAATLARELHDVDRLSSFFDLIQQDPVVSQVKLIAEPWDVGEGGYQVGNFPALWSEWNGQYRDCVRDLWCLDRGVLGEFASRITGSSDLYEDDGRRPHASINFVTAHDGFTLSDLVSYEQKHNWANGEDNRDGTDDNRSTNCGVEGPTDDPVVVAHRDRLRRNLMATLMLSQGVPMVLHGDEIGRTQQGNNNGYAQDNEISWVDWSDPDEAFLAFCRRLIDLRRGHPALQRHRFLTGRPVAEGELPDVAWFTPQGTQMSWEDWGPDARQVAMWLNGDLAEMGPRGESITDDTLLVCVNAADAPSSQVLPPEEFAPAWALVLDTASSGDPPATRYPAGGTVQLGPRTILFLERRLAPAPAPTPSP
ncbi:glycogen debranching protein GlgX [Dermatobacter hominis]|uniref:glycogen debranching protein GlgX n=1 Tax=Dermatobacter hominis TaxID=2884263 RepID=UPI001D1021EE|nr:glycogen debranching protein GlgX [Dermatobacter hominis]UDY36131.1 glycogen debranching protein GlgX [Dermatobacter hominis]